MTHNRDCAHEHFDMDQPMGNGYIRCAQCGKGIPLERVMLSLDRRIAKIENYMRRILDDVEAVGPVHDVTIEPWTVPDVE